MAAVVASKTPYARYAVQCISPIFTKLTHVVGKRFGVAHDAHGCTFIGSCRRLQCRPWPNNPAGERLRLCILVEGAAKSEGREHEGRSAADARRRSMARTESDCRTARRRATDGRGWRIARGFGGCGPFRG